MAGWWAAWLLPLSLFGKVLCRKDENFLVHVVRSLPSTTHDFLGFLGRGGLREGGGEGDPPPPLVPALPAPAEPKGKKVQKTFRGGGALITPLTGSWRSSPPLATTGSPSAVPLPHFAQLVEWRPGRGRYFACRALSSARQSWMTTWSGFLFFNT